MEGISTAALVFGRAAEHYNDQFSDVSAYSRALDAFCTALPPKANVLELGCGPANLTQYIAARCPGCTILATDLAPEMIAIARRNCPTVDFRLMDARDLSSLPIGYHAVVAGFLLPYLSLAEVAALFVQVARLLAPAGIFYVATMVEDETNKTGIARSSQGEQLLVHFHSRDQIISALSRAGLLVTQQHLQPATLGAKATDLILIAVKNTK